MTDEEREAECRKFTDAWPESHFGPAHIVVSDFNFSPSGHIHWCLGIIWGIQYARREQAEAGRDPLALYERHTDAELLATERLLCYLLRGNHTMRWDLDADQLVEERWTDVKEGKMI